MLYPQPEQWSSTLGTMVTFYIKKNLHSAFVAHSKALHKCFMEDFCNSEMTLKFEHGIK